MTNKIKKIILAGTTSLMIIGGAYFVNNEYHKLYDPRLTNFIDTNQDGTPDVAVDTYYKFQMKDKFGFEYYDLDENRTIKRKLTPSELELFIENKISNQNKKW